MNLSRRHFALSLTAASTASLFGADEKDPTFSTEVHVVNVLATVRDKQGKIIADLKKEDFSLSEDGRAQEIRYFSRESNLPLTLGLLVDTSLSQRTVLAQEKSASFRFLDKVLRSDKDQTFVIHFDHETELLQDLTPSRVKLQKALDELELPKRDQPQLIRQWQGGIGFPGGGVGFPGSGRRQGGRGGGQGRQGGGANGRGRGMGGAGTTLYDAILLASNEITAKQKGRKALILLTDGVDSGSKSFLNDAVEAAQRADTLVYSIYFTGPVDERMARRMGVEMPDGRKILQRISKETGGAFFEVSKKLSIDSIYDQLQEELRNQYSIGYSSDAKAPGGFRAISVTTKRKDAIVQTRSGYFPG